MNPHAAAFALILSQQQQANNSSLTNTTQSSYRGNNHRSLSSHNGRPNINKYNKFGSSSNASINAVHGYMSDVIASQPVPLQEISSLYSNRQQPRFSHSLQPAMTPYQQIPTNYANHIYPLQLPNTLNQSLPIQYNFPQQYPVYSEQTSKEYYSRNKADLTSNTGNQSRDCCYPNQNQLYCEPCEKDFTNITSFHAHNLTHVGCQHPGCNFQASYKVVSAHFHLIHGMYSGSGFKNILVEGQEFRVLLGTSPEEVNQWRLDRKSKYPTQATIEQNKLQIDVLATSGGIVHEESNKRKLFVDNNKKRKKKDTNPSELNRSRPDLNQNQSATASSSSDIPETLVPIDSKPLESSTETELIHLVTTTPLMDLSTSNPIFDESTGDLKLPIQTSNDSKTSKRCAHYSRGHCKSGDNCSFSHNFTPEICKSFLNGKCRRGHRCLYIHEKRNGAQEIDACGEEGNKKKSKWTIPKPFDGGERGTLLKKLLEDQIFCDDNQILQSIRYIVQKNFFDHDDNEEDRKDEQVEEEKEVSEDGMEESKEDGEE